MAAADKPAVAAATEATKARESTSSQLSAFELLSQPHSNPFINATITLDSAVRWRMYTIGALLFPIRLLILLSCMSLGALLSLIATAGLSDSQLDEPLSRWRTLVLVPFFPLVRIILFAIGFWPGCITVKGRIAPKSAAAIFVGNHISFIEPIILLYLTGGSPVSAAENARYPLVGAYIRALQAVLVDRSAAGGAANEQARDKIRRRASDPRFPQLILMPEGTTSNGTAVITFKQGAFTPGLPVQPVSIRYIFKHFDPSWVSAGPSQYTLLLRCLLTVFNRVEVNFLPPYAPSDAERADPALYAANVQRSIAASLGVRTTQHSYDDVMLTIIARKSHYPPELAVPELNSLKSALSIKPSVAGQYLRVFMAADPEHRGKINFEQFETLFRERIGGRSPGTGSPSAASAAAFASASRPPAVLLRAAAPITAAAHAAAGNGAKSGLSSSGSSSSNHGTTSERYSSTSHHVDTRASSPPTTASTTTRPLTPSAVALSSTSIEEASSSQSSSRSGDERAPLKSYSGAAGLSTPNPALLKEDAEVVDETPPIDSGGGATVSSSGGIRGASPSGSALRVVSATEAVAADGFESAARCEFSDHKHASPGTSSPASPSSTMTAPAASTVSSPRPPRRRLSAMGSLRERMRSSFDFTSSSAASSSSSARIGL